MSNLTQKIPQFVKNFFDSCEIDEKINRFSFFVIRQDGVVLYKNKTSANKLDDTSIGALLSGVWQASRALAGYIPKNQNQEGFRLSFDTSSQGIYIVPVACESDELYMGVIYHEEVNPGFLKNKMRDLAMSFSNFLEGEFKNANVQKPVVKDNTNKAEFLFSDISDDEMDQLFSFAKN